MKSQKGPWNIDKVYRKRGSMSRPEGLGGRHKRNIHEDEPPAKALGRYHTKTDHWQMSKCGIDSKTRIAKVSESSFVSKYLLNFPTWGDSERTILGRKIIRKFKKRRIKDRVKDP